MPPSLRVQLGRRIRVLRAKREWYQVDLAAHAGISRKYVSDIERGTSDVCLDVIERLAKAFEVEVYELFRLPTPKK